MKKNLLTVSIAALAFAGAAVAQDVNVEPISKTFEVAADTWLDERSPAATNRGSADKIETNQFEQKDENDEANGVFLHLAGLLGFDFQIPEGMKVSSAKLYIVTERVKGDITNFYGYSNDFAENTSWNNESDYIATALETDPVYSARVAGQWNKAITDGLNDENKELSKWVNEIDVTNYVKGVTGSRVNFLIIQPKTNGNNKQVCFFSNDVQDKEIFGATIEAASLRPHLTVTFVEDADVTVETILPRADTFVRSDGNNADKNYGSNDGIEVRHQFEDDGVTRKAEFYGLLSFELPAEALTGQYDVKKAELRLVTKSNRSDRNMNIHQYDNDFDETKATFNTEKNYIAAALESDPIATFQAKGQGAKSLWDNGINDSYKDIEEWTNYIDLTNHVIALTTPTRANEVAKNVSILIAKKEAATSSMVFYPKDKNADETNSNTNITYPKENLWPQLTLTLAKKGTTTAVDEVEVEDEDVKAEYYNLQGIRVMNPEKGVYIVKKGNKVSKVAF